MTCLQSEGHASLVRYSHDQLVELEQTHPTTTKNNLLINTLINNRIYMQTNKRTRRGTTGKKNRRGPDRGIVKNNLLSVPVVTDFSLNTKDLKIGCFNAQSACNKTQEINDLITENEIDILCITETWIKSNDTYTQSEMTPAGYSMVSFPRYHRRGGGIAFIHRDMKANITSRTFKSLELRSFEAASLCIQSSSQQNTIICIYRPPPNRKNKLTLSLFLEEFDSFLSHLNTTLTTPFIITGDFNFHMDVPSSSDTMKMNSLLDSHHLYQHIDQQTHKSGHTLDLLITKNDGISPTNVIITDLALSDHFLITFQGFIESSDKQKRNVMSRDLKKINIQSFKNDVLKSLSSDGDKSVDTLSQNLRLVLDLHAPQRTRKLTKRPSAPWLSDTILRQKREKRQAERKWRKSGLTIDKQIFTEKRRHLSRAIRAAKRKYFTDKLSSAQTCKQLFTITDCLLHNTKKSPIPDGNDEDNCQRFSEFFDSKISDIRKELDQNSSFFHRHDKYDGVKFNEFTPISQDDLHKFIQSSAPKSCDLDPIPTILLKECLDHLLPHLTEIVNDSLSTGTVPDKFKEAIVKPLLKKPDLDINVLKNYRPVSNLPFLSKVLEKVVLKQLLDHIDAHALRDNFQSAYRANHSTETAVLNVVDDLLLGMDEKKACILVMLDLSAAFDTIDHALLIQRLRDTFGVDGTALEWFVSYLANRVQRVKVNDALSRTKCLNFGVPQGSVLGPILFTLYMQPLTKILQDYQLQYHIYADDTQIYLAVDQKDLNHAISRIEKCVGEVKYWMVANKLKLNDDKTEIIIFGHPKITQTISDLTCNINGANVKSSNVVKNLGCHIDQNLTMEDHIKQLCKTLNFHLHRIGKIRNFIDIDTTKLLISSFVLSKMDYCNSLLLNITEERISRLQRIQNNAARLIFKRNKRHHALPLLKELHWLPLKQRIQYKVLTLTYKCLENNQPSYIRQKLDFYVPGRALRSSNDNRLLKVPPKSNYIVCGGRSFSRSVPSIWNSLPKDLRHAPSADTFKKNMKTYLFKMAF